MDASIKCKQLGLTILWAIKNLQISIQGELSFRKIFKKKREKTQPAEGMTALGHLLREDLSRS